MLSSPRGCATPTMHETGVVTLNVLVKGLHTAEGHLVDGDASRVRSA